MPAQRNRMPGSSTVLVVDDDEMSRQVLDNLLKQENYTALFAKNGVEALDIAARIAPDVVLLDILMPQLDGFEVCRQMRSNPALRHVPIVVLTSLDGRDSRLRGLASGADEFLNKPVDLIELKTRLRTITGLNRFRQLCDERSRFELAVAHSPDAIVLTDTHGEVLHANNAFLQLAGRIPEYIFDCFQPATAETIHTAIAGEQPGLKVESLEAPLAIASNPSVIVEITVVRLPASGDAHFEYILRNITERKLLESQIMRLERIELLGQLASGVVHDVNNLLLAVVLNAELVAAHGDPKSAERAKVIQQGAERGAALLRRILMFARGGDQTLSRLRMPPVLRETATIAGKLLGEHITLEVDAPDELPPIVGDANQLHQVVMNLCLNARDAMPNGGRLQLKAETVSLNAVQARAIAPDATPGDFVALSVRDTGTGIAPEIRDRLFDPFFTTKPRETATGLGLATVLRVMRHHRGFVAFKSKVGDGTCFTCYFPTLLPPAPPA